MNALGGCGLPPGPTSTGPACMGVFDVHHPQGEFPGLPVGTTPAGDEFWLLATQLDGGQRCGWVFTQTPKDRTSAARPVAPDLLNSVLEEEEGVASQGVTPTGKPVGEVGYGRVGANSYTQWFSGDPDMAGTYGGYDGPCPPWNDLLVHRYHFTVYALSGPTLDAPEGFEGPALLSAIQDVALASARHSGTYTLNAALR